MYTILLFLSYFELWSCLSGHPEFSSLCNKINFASGRCMSTIPASKFLDTPLPHCNTVPAQNMIAKAKESLVHTDW